MNSDPQAALPLVPRRLGLGSATAAVVASMIGTGVFSTSGILVGEFGSPGIVLVAWALGGVFALCGALAYAELAACLPSNGGEYRFLSATIHPAVGFVSGWVSLVVGFSAPIAASALAFGSYLHAIVPALPPTASGIALVLLLSGVHSVRVAAGASIQNGLTLAQVLLIVGFVVGAIAVLPALPADRLAFSPREALSPRFAVGLILVSFAYGGWNGAAYLAGEVRNPSRNLPLALGLGTAVVMCLYLALNAVFLLGTTPTQIAGVVEVGHVAAVTIFGPDAGSVLSSLIALALVSSVSAMTMVGPRVYEAVGRDYPALRLLGLRKRSGGPIVSIALQAGLAITMLLTFSFGTLLSYIGFTLSISSALTVIGLYVNRRREPTRARPYRVWGYPVTPAMFVLFVGWMIVHSLWERPVLALLGAGTAGVGLLLYAAVSRTRLTATGQDGS